MNNEYDDIPVVYCKQCLHLGIIDEYGVDKCNNCGSINIGTTKIDEWDTMFVDRYGLPYLNYKIEYGD